MRNNPNLTIEENIINALRNRNITPWEINDYLTEQNVTILDFEISDLDLEENRVINEAMSVKLAKALMNNKTVTELYLTNNAIGNNGVAEFGVALRSNQTLTELYLGNNGIDGTINDGAAIEDLAIGLKNSSLKKIDLVDNTFNGLSFFDLTQAVLSENCKITEFNISNDPEDNESRTIQDAIALREYLKESPRRLQTFMMGTHRRLGAISPIRSLPIDVIGIISDKVKKEAIKLLESMNIEEIFDATASDNQAQRVDLISDEFEKKTEMLKCILEHFGKPSQIFVPAGSHRLQNQNQNQMRRRELN